MNNREFILNSISRIYEEITILVAKSLYLSQINNEFTIFHANSLWIHYLLREFTTISLSFLNRTEPQNRTEPLGPGPIDFGPWIPDCKLEIQDLNSRSDNNPFEIHEVWLNHPLKRPEGRTGTSGYNRLVKMITVKSSAD